jgi:CRP/FNR family transcriptional regulator
MELEKKIIEAEFFENLPPGSLKQLAEICMPRKAKKKEVLFLEGNEGGIFFLLLSGRVQLYRLSEDGKEVAIKVIGPGEIFAEVIIFEEDRYPVCASALTDCELIAVPTLQFVCLLENHDFRNDFIGMLMKKQRYLTNQIMYLTSNDVESRFYRFLIDQYGDSGEYEIGISKKDIATAIGATPETLSRMIHRLSESGLIDWRGTRLWVDPSCFEYL